MTTTLAPNAGPMVQEDTPLTTQDTSRAPEATDTSAPPRKRLRRSKRQEKANGECEHDKEAPFFTSDTPPPLQKVASEPIFGPDACDNGTDLRLIDVSSLAKGLEHLCCRKCSEENVDTHMQDFFEFHAEKMKSAKLLRMKNPSLEESYKKFIGLL